MPNRSFVGTVPLTIRENKNKTQGIIGARKLKIPKKVIIADGFFLHHMYTSIKVKGGPRKVSLINDANT